MCTRNISIACALLGVAVLGVVVCTWPSRATGKAEDATTSRPTDPGDRLRELSEQIEKAEDEAQGMAAIKDAISLVRETPGISLDEKVAFATCVYNFAAGRAAASLLADEVFMVLKVQHRGQHLALGRILRLEGQFALLRPETRPQGVKRLAQAVEELEDARVEAALRELDTAYELGEAYLLCTEGGPASNPEAAKARDAALLQCRKVLEFPIYDQPYIKRLREFQEIYLKAARRFVASAPESELAETSLYPFALRDVKEMMPARAEKLSKEGVGAGKLRKTIIFWLQASLNGELEESPMRPHLRAVLDYAKK